VEDKEAVELHPLVKEIAASFYVKEGMLVLDREVAEGQVNALGRLPIGEREEVAVHLTMVAQRMKQEAGPEGMPSIEAAIHVLVVYIVMVVGEREAVSDLLEGAGLQNDAAAVIGTTEGIKAPAAKLDVQPKDVKAKRGLKKD